MQRVVAHGLHGYSRSGQHHQFFIFQHLLCHIPGLLQQRISMPIILRRQETRQILTDKVHDIHHARLVHLHLQPCNKSRRSQISSRGLHGLFQAFGAHLAVCIPRSKQHCNAVLLCKLFVDLLILLHLVIMWQKLGNIFFIMNACCQENKNRAQTEEQSASRQAMPVEILIDI